MRRGFFLNLFLIRLFGFPAPVAGYFAALGGAFHCPLEHTGNAPGIEDCDGSGALLRP